jgi:hypothetical protein
MCPADSFTPEPVEEKMKKKKGKKKGRKGKGSVVSVIE